MSEVGMDNELRFSVAAVGSVKKDLLLKLGWKADPVTDICWAHVSRLPGAPEDVANEILIVANAKAVYVYSYENDQTRIVAVAGDEEGAA